jgi:transposase
MWTDSARRQYQRSGARYASDLTDEEFALIEPMLPAVKRGGRRRTTVLREVLNAILYLLRTGCQWRMLPKEFPPRSTVYDYFRKFWQLGTWKHIWMTLLMAAREQAGKEASPTAAIIDSQSVKTTEAGGPKGYDGGKKGRRPQAAPAGRHARADLGPGRLAGGPDRLGRGHRGVPACRPPDAPAGQGARRPGVPGRGPGGVDRGELPVGFGDIGQAAGSDRVRAGEVALDRRADLRLVRALSPVVEGLRAQPEE